MIQYRSLVVCDYNTVVTCVSRIVKLCSCRHGQVSRVDCFFVAHGALAFYCYGAEDLQQRVLVLQLFCMARYEHLYRKCFAAACTTHHISVEAR